MVHPVGIWSKIMLKEIKGFFSSLFYEKMDIDIVIKLCDLLYAVPLLYSWFGSTFRYRMGRCKGNLWARFYAQPATGGINLWDEHTWLADRIIVCIDISFLVHPSPCVSLSQVKSFYKTSASL